MKKIFPLLIVIFYLQTCQAQMIQLGQSEKFPEPAIGYGKVLVLDNARTMYLHYEKGGLSVRIYDRSRKLSSKSTISVKNLGIDNSRVLQLFEMNGNVYVFIIGNINKSLSLVRVQIDVNSGEAKEKIVLHSLNKISVHVSMTKGNSLDDCKNFVVRKSEYSNDYVIAIYNPKAKDKDKRLRIEHYDEKTGLKNLTFFPMVEKKFKFLDLKEIAIAPNGSIYFLFFNYLIKIQNGKRSGGFYMGLFKDGKISSTNLNLKDGFLLENSIAKYNKTNKQVVFLNMVKVSPREARENKLKGRSYTDYYVVQLLRINAESEKIVGVSSIPLKEFLNKRREYRAGQNKIFAASPQNLYFDKKGNSTVILENLGTIAGCEDLAIINFDKYGQYESSQLVPKKHYVSGENKLKKLDVDHFYHSKYTNSSACIIARNEHYKSFSYVNGINGKYILVNDVIENQQGNTGKSKKMEVFNNNIQDCSAYAYKLGGLGFVPASKELFSGESGNLGFFLASHYHSRNDIFVTLRRTTDNKMRLVWMQPD